LFIRLQDGTEASSFVFGYDEVFITIFLFMVSVCACFCRVCYNCLLISLQTNIGVIVTGLVFMAKDLVSDQKLKVLRFAKTGSIVRLSKLEEGHYHIFLSHAHKHAADQVAIICYQLQQMIEGVTIFLDVDSLSAEKAGSLKNLPTLVRNSKVLLAFLTEDVFTFWVNVEIATAIKASNGTIAVYETDPRHGALSLEVLKSQCPPAIAADLFKSRPIMWTRDGHLKTISLKKMVQRLLLITEPAKYTSGLPQLLMPGEIVRKHFGPLPLISGREHHVYVTPSDSTFSVCNALRELFVAQNLEFRIAPAALNDSASEQDRQQAITSSCAVLLPVSVFAVQDARVHADLRCALQLGVHIVLLHLHKPDDGPLDNQFGDIIKNCPEDIGNQVFTELAIEWHLDPDYAVVGQRMVWQRMAAVCSGDFQGSKNAPVSAGDIELELSAAAVKMT
jgi:hypothetical protein